MAHNIIGNQIAYKNETPWHGLGHRVNPGMTGIEMLRVAGLDWTVQRRALAMRNSNREVVTEPLKGFRAIVRADTDEVFQVATDTYHIVQNQEIVDFFREFCEAGQAEMDVVGALHGGSTIWALAKVNADATIGTGDELKAYLLLATSHDGSMATIGKGCSTRVVCNNTLTVALGEKNREFKMKHTRKLGERERGRAREVMGMVVEGAQLTAAVADTLSRIRIDQRDRLEYVLRVIDADKTVLEHIVDAAENPGKHTLETIMAQEEAQKELGRLGKSLLEAIVDSPGSHLPTARNTLWGAVNGVTYYVDHKRGRTPDSRLDAAWFGDGDALKTKAVKVATEMAGVELLKAA